MESPVVLDKPPEYHGSKNDERGFPFDEEEGSGAWSSLAARHPDIAARLRQRPATWARKRRPSSQDPTDDFGDNFGGFDRFPFDDIPPEFREHFPSHWGRRFTSDEPQQPHPPAAAASPQPQQSSAGTQTDAAPAEPEPGPAPPAPPAHLPQYGLRNTVDLGQRSAADPSVDADDRNQRSMSAPPDSRGAPPAPSAAPGNMNHAQPDPPAADHAAGNVRHIPIFVEGRDEPVINRSVDHGAHFGETKPPPQPHVDRDQYFADDGPPSFHHPPNFTRAFGTPFNKGYRPGPQPFTQQKAYPQAAYNRGASPQRSQSPKAPPHPQQHAAPEEPFVRVPVQHEHAAPPRPAQKQQHPQQHHPQQHQHPQQQHHPAPPQQHPQQHPQPPHAASPPPPPKPAANDPITLILSIQTDVLNLMSEVENFTGTKKDKRYIYLDEMLTRNLIKLDNIETEGKENIRTARKEAIKCIQKCIAVLEAKAEKGSAPADAEMQPAEQKAGNGEVDMQESTKEQTEPPAGQAESAAPVADEQKPQEQPQAADTRPDQTRAVLVDNKPEEKSSEDNVDKKTGPKKGTKVVKKRDKSKDKAAAAESMQVDDKGDNENSPTMEVDGAAASQ